MKDLYFLCAPRQTKKGFITIYKFFIQDKWSEAFTLEEAIKKYPFSKFNWLSIASQSVEDLFKANQRIRRYEEAFKWIRRKERLYINVKKRIKRELKKQKSYK